MKKATKGAVAAGAAAVLLLGGLGSFALWSDSEEIDGGTIESGELSLTEATAPVWRQTTTDVNAASVIPVIADYRIVPGDVITYSATYNILAEGNNLLADLSVDIDDIAPGLGNEQLDEAVDVTIAATSGGTTLPTDGNAVRITSTNQTVDLTITFAFDEGTENQDAQNQQLNLEAFTLVLQQSRTPAP
ncbi:alternate-type signal peptide domain-containing protein [Rhodococcus sp. H36-A4]|uniref:alternate-type signal peptide domain-containing protein n=1 Tax=Rhodococcus sp. H36-A4 TaxID=3004353 RepID=UPI0022AEB1C7|nr:alternate-type signal peptide domain-containing protein [Rhodococcus sp. H36-A4]MCZ4080471.1 alternate-type signal peptide domain-containing protein [Rhodococcus sp. H36-A4]